MLLQQVINGLTIGCTYAMVAVGFSMVYGVLQLVNFAHGAFYLLGAYLVITFAITMNMNFMLGLLLALLVTSLLGAGMDRFLLNPIRKQSTNYGVSSLIATLGVGTVITNLLVVLYGSQTLPFPNKIDFGRMQIGNAYLKGSQIVIMVAAVLMMLVLYLIVYKTKMGTAMRAISQNIRASQLMGIPVNRVIMTTFFIGTLCAAIGGVLVSMYYASIDTAMYIAVNLKTFATAVLGGIGSMPGAMLGGVIIGLAETLFAGYVSSDYKSAVAFIVLILVLLIKPSGIFGQKQNDKL